MLAWPCDFIIAAESAKFGHANARLTSEGRIVDIGASKKISTEDGSNEFDVAFAKVFEK